MEIGAKLRIKVSSDPGKASEVMLIGTLAMEDERMVVLTNPAFVIPKNEVETVAELAADFSFDDLASLFSLEDLKEVIANPPKVENIRFLNDDNKPKTARD